MVACQSLRIEDLIDGENHDLKLQLEPQGTLQLSIMFENTLHAPRAGPSRGLRRQEVPRLHDVIHAANPLCQGLFKAKQMRGKKLMRPADLDIDIGPRGVLPEPGSRHASRVGATTARRRHPARQ